MNTQKLKRGDTPPSRKSPRWISAALVIATFVAYAPALRAPFEFDDIASIPANPTIRSLRPISIPLHPPSNTSVAGRPVVNYSLALNYAVNEWLGVDQRPDPLGPTKTLGYHVVNLLLHVVCGLLLLGVIRRTVIHGSPTEPREWIAPVVAGLWLLHPIQTDAVDYLIQRTEVIASLCCLGTLYTAIRAWDAESSAARTYWRTAAVIICLMGMGSKETAIVIPMLIVLYDRAFRVRSWVDLVADRSRVLFYALLAATSVWAIVLIASNSRFDTVGFGLGLRWYEYLYSQAWAIAHYLRLVVWPDQLTFDYGQRPVTGLRGVPGLILLVAFAIATLAAWLRVDRWGWFAFLGAWFFMTLAPSSSVVPITTEIAAERRVYLALASVLVLIVVGLAELRRRVRERLDARWVGGLVALAGVFYGVVAGWTASTTAPNKPALSLSIRAVVAVAAMSIAFAILRGRRPWAPVSAIAMLLLGATAMRSLTYTNAETLWRDTVRKAPTNPRALDILAFNLFYDVPPRLAEAKDLYWQAVALDSTYLHPWPGLASIAVNEGRPAEAVWLLERALAINPNYADAVDHLGKLYLKLGRADRAIPYLARFAASYPADTSFIVLGRAYMATGRLSEASTAFRNALHLNSARSDAAEYLGGILAEQGHGAEAVPLLEQAASSAEASGVLFGLLSLAYAETGRADDAARAAAVAIERARGDANALILAGRAMLLAQRPPQADEYLSQAVVLAPTNAEALTALGLVKDARGDHAAAVALFQRALAVDSTFAPARNALRARR